MMIFLNANGQWFYEHEISKFDFLYNDYEVLFIETSKTHLEVHEVEEILSDLDEKYTKKNK